MQAAGDGATPSCEKSDETDWSLSERQASFSARPSKLKLKRRPQLPPLLQAGDAHADVPGSKRPRVDDALPGGQRGHVSDASGWSNNNNNISNSNNSSNGSCNNGSCNNGRGRSGNNNDNALVPESSSVVVRHHVREDPEDMCTSSSSNHNNNNNNNNSNNNTVGSNANAKASSSRQLQQQETVLDLPAAAPRSADMMTQALSSDMNTGASIAGTKRGKGPAGDAAAGNKRARLASSAAPAPGLAPYIGLTNLGNTCWCGVVLQSMLHLQLVRRAIEPFLSAWSARPLETPVLSAFADLLVELDAGNAALARQEKQALRRCRPKAFLARVRSVVPQFAGHSQQDATEFWRFLIDSMVEWVKYLFSRRVALSNLSEDFSANAANASQNIRQVETERECITKTFQGRVESVLQCLECEDSNCRTETFLDLSVPVSMSPGQTLQECLSSFFASEMMRSSNKYACDMCRTHTEAKRFVWMTRLPSILTIHVNRFAPSAFAPSVFAKNATVVQCPLMLNVSAFTSPKCADRDTVYRLGAVVLHFGNGLLSGHYTHLQRMRGGSWVHFDDGVARPMSHLAVLQLLVHGTTAGRAPTPYLLMYEQVLDGGDGGDGGDDDGDGDSSPPSPMLPSIHSAAPISLADANDPVSCESDDDDFQRYHP